MRDLSICSDLSYAVRSSLASSGAGEFSDFHLDVVFDLDLHVDIESRSELDLKEVGLDKYSKHPSTQIFMASWALVDTSTGERVETCQWDGTATLDTRCERLVALLENPRVKVIAHNAQFERTMFRNVWQVNSPVWRWRCSMAYAYMLGLPGSLERVGEVTLMPDEFRKVAQGKKYINTFCKIQKATTKKPKRFNDRWSHPEKWQEFLFYNRQDVEAEAYLWYERLLRFGDDVAPDEWAMWFIDQEINERGLPVNAMFVRRACELIEIKTEELMSDMKTLTGLDNPNSDPQFGPWARARGYGFGDLRKETIERAMEDPESEMTEECRAAFVLRKQLKRTAVKKFFTIDGMHSDGWLRYQYQYCGASRTGRWSGRGAQPQNPARPAKVYEPEARQRDIIDCVLSDDNDVWNYFRLVYSDLMLALSSTVRASVSALPGFKLVVCDLSSIESRVVAWLSRCESKLQAFKDGLDPYKHFATIWMGVKYALVTKEQRNMAKNPELGCGFGLGGGDLKFDRKTGDMKKTGMWSYSERNGIPLTRDQSHDAVRVYREAFPEVVQTWYAYENAARKAIGSGSRVVCDHAVINGFVHDIEPIVFDSRGPFLRITLPSGRKLRYLRPKIELKKTPWDEMKWTITYEGMEDDEESKVWGRTPTRGAKIFENIVQAIANDFMRHGLIKARARGFNIVLHSHDEIGAHERKTSRLGAPQLRECMIDLPWWAKTFPIDAKATETDFWMKD